MRCYTSRTTHIPECRAFAANMGRQNFGQHDWMRFRHMYLGSTVSKTWQLEGSVRLVSMRQAAGRWKGLASAPTPMIDNARIQGRDPGLQFQASSMNRWRTSHLSHQRLVCLHSLRIWSDDLVNVEPPPAVRGLFVHRNTRRDTPAWAKRVATSGFPDLRAPAAGDTNQIGPAGASG